MAARKRRRPEDGLKSVEEGSRGAVARSETAVQRLKRRVLQGKSGFAIH